MKLFYAAGSCALVVHIALEEAGADYEVIPVRFDQEQQRSPEFLALNPLGRVPVLATGQGVLTEVPAILGYVAACYTAACLVPDDPFELARMNSFNAFVSSTLHPTFAHHKRPYRWADDEKCRQAISEKAAGTYADQFGLIEAGMLVGPWVMGSQFTVADPYLYVMARWLAMANIDIAQYPRVAAHFESMGGRAAVQRALAMEGL